MGALLICLSYRNVIIPMLYFYWEGEGEGGGGGHGCVRPQLKKSGSIVVSFPHLGDEHSVHVVI